MRIAQVANFYGPRSGGIRTTMTQLGLGYGAWGVDSVLVVPGARDSDVETAAGRMITLAAPTVPWSGGYRMITDVDRVCTVLDSVAPDRLEVSDRSSLRALGWWARACGIPAVMWAHERVDGVLDAHLPGRWPVRRMADSWNASTAARFDRVVCSTHYAQEEFDRIRHTAVSHVPLGVDLLTFSPESYDAGLRAELAGDADVLLVMCSRLSKEKQPWVAFDTLEELVRRGVNARLVVMGAGPMRDRLVSRSRHLPVSMLGHVQGRERVAGVLACADVVIAPGPIETFGLAALEALACGTPVVASRRSALREIVVDKAGIAVDGGTEQFADAVQTLLSTPAERRRRGARERAEEFPWSRTVRRMLEVHGIDTRTAAGAGA